MSDRKLQRVIKTMDKIVEIIEPTKNIYKIDSDKPLNVCAYCRVSTEEEDQRHSLKSQKMFFESFFEEHPNWTNAGIFSDEGLSGTSLEKRDAFNQMLAKARKGEIDIILTKELSRFSRNTRDLLNVVKELKDRKVYIWFLSDDINTEDNSAIDKLTQIAAAAQSESLKTSRRVLWGQSEQMKRGVVFGPKEMLGYNIKRDEHGKQYFEIIEEEAEIVRKIFEWFASGDGTYKIARKLESEGIKTKRYKNGWSSTVILRILRNEKYVGDLVQGKTYTPEPLNHKKKYNKGNSKLYVIKNHHPESAIIDRDTWDKVQAILKDKAPDNETKAKYSNRYWSSGKVFCGLCGARYVIYSKRQKSVPYKAWICFENHQRGRYKPMALQSGEIINVGCNNKRVNDRILKSAVHDIITVILKSEKDKILSNIAKEINTPKKNESGRRKIIEKQKAIKQIQNSITNLTRKYVDAKIPENAYYMTLQSLNDELEELNRQVNRLIAEDTAATDKTKQIEYYINEVKNIISLSDQDVNEEIYERVTKKIVVFPDNILEIHLSFLFKPRYLHYVTSGRGNSYTATFNVLTDEEVAAFKDNLPQNAYFAK